MSEPETAGAAEGVALDPRVADALPEGALHELRALFDPRFLNHRVHHLEAVLAWRDALGHPLPRIVEIGSHEGTFLVGAAPAFAPERLLGIEWRGANHRTASSRAVRRGVENVDFLLSDARLAIPVLFSPGSIDTLFVNFPDPWWRTRHQSRRLLDVPFLRVIARRLGPTGRLLLKSDVFDYLYRVRACAEASQALVPLPPHLWPDEQRWPPTPRERKCMASALPFGRGYYRAAPGLAFELPTASEGRWTELQPNSVDPIELLRGPPLTDRRPARGANLQSRTSRSL